MENLNLNNYDIEISDVFKTAVDKYGNNQVISDDLGSITYKELYKMSLSLASRLVRLHSWKDQVIVAVDLPKDRNLFILLLAIYQAGGVFLPISRTSPKHRLISMIEEGKADIFISDSNDRFEIVEFNIQKIPIQPLIDNLIMEKPLVKTSIGKKDNLAYIMFTSGSTGKPKGIMVTHSSVIHMAQACYSRFFNLPEDVNIETLRKMTKEYIRIGILCDLSFDPSVVQLYMALFFGHCIVPVPDEIKRSQWELSQYWKRQKVEMCDITPTHLNQVLSYYEKDTEGLFLPKNIVSVGEPFSLEFLKKIFNIKDIQVQNVINAYGPTEVTVYCNVKVYNRNQLDKVKHISVGKPLVDYRINILDETGKPVPQGKTGEIYVTSKFLSLGYVSRKDLTEQSFLPDINGSPYMMYKTNDCGRFDENNELICMGRNDDQIKIRGHRIELGEIENVLIRNEFFKEVHVLSKKNNENIDQIIVFYKENKIDEDSIREEMKEFLPEYMMPKHYIQVEEFIRNNNGKLDKRHLLEKVKFNDITTNVENDNQILNICRNILQNENLLMEDSFFKQGATSLDVFILNSNVYNQWGIVLDNSRIYKCKTIKEIDDLIQESVNISKSNSLGKDNYLPKEEMVQATEFQRKILRSEKRVRKSNKIDKPLFNVVYRVSHTNYIDGRQLKYAMGKMVERHRILRSYFFTQYETVYIKSQSKGVVDFFYIKVENLREVDFSSYNKNFLANSLPLFSIILFEDKRKNQEMLFSFHHGIFDYLSLNVFLNEIFRLYYDISLQHNVYDFFEYRKDIEKFNKKELKEFWTEYLKDRIKPVSFLGSGENTRMRLNKDETFSIIKRGLNDYETSALRNICKILEISVFNFMSTVLAQILYDDTKQKDLLIATIQHGRMRKFPQASNCIGLFGELLPLRFQFKDDMTIEGILKNQQNILNQTLKNQGLGMNELYLMQDFDERIKGEFFKVAINYQTDYRCELPEDKGSVYAKEIGEFPELIPMHIRVIEHKDDMTINFISADSIYIDRDIERIAKLYLNSTRTWIRVLMQRRSAEFI